MDKRWQYAVILPESSIPWLTFRVIGVVSKRRLSAGDERFVINTG